MLIGGILAALVVAGIVAAAVMRHRTQDDVHSVEHYHRQLHTLEEIRSHPPSTTEGNGDGDGDKGGAAFPASAFRVSGSSTVRLTEPGRTIVPPAPPPPVPNPAEPVQFDDAPSEASKSNFLSGSDDRAMHSINHRPKRLGGPIAAIAAVAVLVVILIVTGFHSNTPTKHRGSGTATTETTAPARSHPRAGAAGTSSHKGSTASTLPPVVSAPVSTSAFAASYQVGEASYSLALSATSSDCWISATNASSGAVLFTGILTPGESHTIAATGPVTVVAGAPAAFAATVNGAAVTLPSGFQAPFTLKFETPASG